MEFVSLCHFMTVVIPHRYPEIVHRQDTFWEARQRSMNEAFRARPQTPPSSPTKQRGSRSGGRRRDSSISSDGEGRATPGRQRKKSTSQIIAGPEHEHLTNGSSDGQVHSRRMSSSISMDTDSAEPKHLNNGPDHSTVPHKRTKKNMADDTLS